MSDDKIIVKIIDQIGNAGKAFTFHNDESTKHIAGRFRLKVYKMPADIVPDPEKRYIEASVFDSVGCYKTEMLVGSGNKEEIITIMKTEKFRMKLYDTYIRLLDMLRG